MNKKLIPSYYLNNIFDIDISKIKQLDIKYLFIDLDNTLANPYVYYPDDGIKNLINNYKENGFNITILSNNHEKRVQDFTKDLDVSYLFEVKKPKTKKLNEYIIMNNINVDNCLIIGDQVMTDILLANRLNIKSILLDPLTKQDEPITFFPRLLDKYFKRKIRKKHLDRKL